jgi:hypothetical protein
MSGRIKIRGLAWTVAVAILFAGIAYGQDPCGGHYVGEGLRALFAPLYDAPTCNGGGCNVLNDMDGVYYQYLVPGGDCIFLFKAGHVIVGIGMSGRTVVMNLDQRIDGPDCPPIPYETLTTQSFQLRTGFGFTASRGYLGDPDTLVLTSTNATLNFAKMTPGQTTYCQISIKFSVANDPALYEHHFQAKVFYGFTGGALRWVITPIDEPYWVYGVTKVGKKLVRIEPPTDHVSSVNAEIGSDYCGYYGTYCLPFKLIFERLR